MKQEPTTNAQQILSSSTEEKKIIEVRNLRKSFGSQKVLDNVSFDLFNGENLVILGKSGTGKSVLIKCIVGLLIPDKGTINVLGKDVINTDAKELNELRKKIGFLFQGAALYDSMTVKENMEFPLKRICRDMKANEREERIEEVLENVGLTDALYKMPSQLSGGMRKRIGLARTLIVNPVIMLYDEPTTGLDPVTAEEISLLINDVQDKYKTSSIIITHDIQCADTTADRVIMLDEGTVRAEGTIETLKKSNDQFITSFFKS